MSQIRHIVMWRLKGSSPDDKRVQAEAIKAALEALNGQIPGLLRLEVGIDLSGDADSGDVVLVSDFADHEALKAYHTHPLHRQAGEVVKACRTERRVVDYLI